MGKSIFLNNVGNISFIRSSKAKRLTIRIKENDGVKVTVPNSVSFKSAEQFVFQKSEWIKTNLRKVQLREEKNSVFTGDTQFKTYYHKLHIQKAGLNRPKALVQSGTLAIYYPAHRNVQDPNIQGFIHRAIELTLRNEAKYYLPKRVEELIAKYNFNIKKVYVKNVKTRWGSCSGVNNINLNIHLMRLPQRLIDYVILHELCHTVHKNHGKDFWALLNKITDNKAKILAREIKGYRITVY